MLSSRMFSKVFQSTSKDSCQGFIKHFSKYLFRKCPPRLLSIKSLKIYLEDHRNNCKEIPDRIVTKQSPIPSEPDVLLRIYIGIPPEEEWSFQNFFEHSYMVSFRRSSKQSFNNLSKKVKYFCKDLSSPQVFPHIILSEISLRIYLKDFLYIHHECFQKTIYCKLYIDFVRIFSRMLKLLQSYLQNAKEIQKCFQKFFPKFLHELFKSFFLVINPINPLAFS